MTERLTDIIIEELIELKNCAIVDSLPDLLGEESELFGLKGFLDSLGLVNLVVALEGKVLQEFGVGLALADNRAVSQHNSPFRTIGLLASYIEQRIKESGDE